MSNLIDGLKGLEAKARPNPAQATAARVLTIDIETTPIVAHVWGLWKQNVGLNQIVEDPHVLCVVAKWLGEDDTLFFSDWADGHEAMIQQVWDLLDEADIVVTYNGISFDDRWLNSEFVLAGLPRPRPYRDIDIMRVSKKVFRWPSYKLDFLAQRLGLGHKVEHTGHDLWVGCMGGDSEAQALMEEYNRGDVTLTEQVYLRLLPWLDGSANLGLWADGDGDHCPQCGSGDLESIAPVATGVRLYAAYRCGACGAVSRGVKMEKGVSVRAAA